MSDYHCVIVTGDRNAEFATWRQAIAETLKTDYIGKACVVLHGDARGIDRIADRLAHLYAFEVVPVPAMWTQNRLAAGPIRNSKIAKMAELLQEQGYTVACLAFHDSLEDSKGTKDMVQRAHRKGFPVKVVSHSGDWYMYGEDDTP